MSGNIRNVIVGAAEIFLTADNLSATDVTLQNQPLPTLVAGTDATVTLAASASWRDVGFTMNGLSIVYTPTYDDITVDQLKDAATLFSTALTVEAQTQLSETVLNNLMTVFGQNPTSLNTTGAPETQGATDTLAVTVGTLNDSPVEHSFAAVGKAPRTPGGKRRQRVYYARRVVSVDAVTTAMSRTDPSVFPVTFRLLPDPSYSGQEYGNVIDRTL